MKQIYIENYRVDVSRCEVHRENDIVSLEPKVMQVLLYLVKHQGEVVSRQALLDEVWSGSIVEANALQRCIGQLRKAFNDDAKQQRVIATYPKNGYSLLATDKKRIPATTRSKVIPAIGLAAIVIISVIIMFSNRSQKFETNSVQALSQNQAPDFYTFYSPDGRYVVYPKPVDNEETEETDLRYLWLLDLTDNKEIRLTPEPGHFGDPAWAPNSKALAFVQSETACSTLKQVSLSASEPQTLIDCQTSRLQSPQWTSLNNIALIESNETISKVIHYDLDRDAIATLFQQNNLKPQQLAYSAETNMLAITTINTDSLQQLQLLSLSSKELNTLTIALPARIMNEAWYPVWNLQHDGLIISSSEGVFNIALDGSVSQQSSPLN